MVKLYTLKMVVYLMKMKLQEVVELDFSVDIVMIYPEKKHCCNIWKQQCPLWGSCIIYITILLLHLKRIALHCLNTILLIRCRWRCNKYCHWVHYCDKELYYNTTFTVNNAQYSGSLFFNATHSTLVFNNLEGIIAKFHQ